MNTRKASAPGGALQAYLSRHRISQQEFADKLEVSQALVSAWVRGRIPITPEKAKLIERVYGIPRLALLYPDEHAA